MNVRVLTFATYVAACFLVFTAAWRYYGLRHVELANDMREDWPTAVYYSVMTAIAFTPPGESPPKDVVARRLITAQSLLSWVTVLYMIT